MKKQLLHTALSLLFLLTGSLAFAQVTVTSSDSLDCTTHCTVLRATVRGDAPIDAGIRVDDIYSIVHPIGFTFNYYGTPRTDLVIGPNGTLCFDLSLAGAYDPWPIGSVLLGNTSKLDNICGPWCDIDVTWGGTITYSLDGTAPNRRYIVTFCNDHMFSCTDQITSTQMILHETTDIIEVHVAFKDICAGWNSGRAIIGVQNAAGTAATVAPGRDFPSVYSCLRESWQFTPVAGGTSYTVASIPYAPVPYSASPVHWYNQTTGTYLGTGLTMTVCPTAPSLYAAGAAGCSDTSFGYYFVRPSGSFSITATFTQPTSCGANDGTITLSGMAPGLIDTVTYTLGGVPQPPVIAMVSSLGTIRITGLCQGTYDNFVARQGDCSSPSIGPFVLVDPTISISRTSFTPPSACGFCDGTITLYGLYPGRGFNISYNFNGTPQPPTTGLSNSAGELVLTGLCEGGYDNIIASFAACVGTCATPPAGPVALNAPEPDPVFVTSFAHPSQCGFCDGNIILKPVPPFTIDTIIYSYNGTPQPPIVMSARADSTVLIPGLCAGAYTGFILKVGPCVYDVFGGAGLVNPAISAGFTQSVKLGCHGDSVTFTNFSASAGPIRYIWEFGDGYSDTATHPVHIYPQGTYTIKLRAYNSYCADSNTASLVLNHPLSAAFTAAPDLICQGSPVAFTNSSVGAPLTYLWDFGNGAGSVSANPTQTYPRAGTYEVMLEVTDGIPCKDTAYTTIQVDTISKLVITASDTVVCRGASISFEGLYAGLGNTGIVWHFGDGDSIKNLQAIDHSYGAAGVFTVSATASYRICQDAGATQRITILEQPTVSLGPDVWICPGSEQVVLSATQGTPAPGTAYRWSNGATTPTITVMEPGKFFVIAAIGGCKQADTIEVQKDCYMDIPNVFTPDGDGINDYFLPKQYLTKGLTTFSQRIYNRWGTLLFESNAIDGRGWDGRFNGTDQPQGVYVYIIDATFRDGQKEHKQGNITLLR